jgi:hypothetical protein
MAEFQQVLGQRLAGGDVVGLDVDELFAKRERGGE